MFFMTREFDPKKSYLTLKAHEKMIAYVGFRFQSSSEDNEKEGIVKISGNYHPYGGGHLTLTFIVDTAGDEALKVRLNDIFNNLTDAAIRPELGKSFEKIVKVSLDSLAHIQDWYVEEINIHFRSMQERENVLVEAMLLPALQNALGFAFNSVEWWPEGLKHQPISGDDIAEHPSLKALIKKWFSFK
jgi:hypothetical protein